MKDLIAIVLDRLDIDKNGFPSKCLYMSAPNAIFKFMQLMN